MKKICLEQKGHPPIWASLKEATFHTFPYWKHGEPFKLQKVGSARRVTHFVQSPSCNGRVSLLAGPTFLRGTLHAFHWTKIPVLNFGKTTCPVEGTFQLQRPNQSHREFGYRAWKQDTDHWSWENNFLKWKETFRSDRLDQIRSVSVKGSHSQGETMRACAKAGWGQCFFFSRQGEWLSYTR